MNYIALFCVLQLADLITTFIGIRAGIGAEANLFPAWIIKSIGLIPGLVFVKLVAFGWLWLCLFRKKPFAVKMANGLYVLLVLNNLYVLSR